MNLAYVSLFPILGLPGKEWKRQSARECKEEKQNTDTRKETERKRKEENDNKLSYLLNILLSGLTHGC